jgi:hypothetical protein
MLDNHTYNLMAQIVEENKSLWRIKHSYGKDAGECGECTAFWDDMIKDKTKHIEELLEMLKKHIN